MFNKIKQFFKSPELSIETININNFGSFRQRKINIKNLNILNFISLREFHFLEIDFHINDLLKILNNCSGMKSISFTITQNHLTSIEPPPNESYDIFKNLESINVVFHVNPAITLFVDLIEYCLIYLYNPFWSFF